MDAEANPAALGHAAGAVPVQHFAALAAMPRVRHAFFRRVPGLDVRTDRAEALRRLGAYHAQARAAAGFAGATMVVPRQVHGSQVAVIDSATPGDAPEADGLVTNLPGVCLAVYVADCCPVYLVDATRGAIGVLHSGKKGTELNIARQGVETMRQAYGTEPGHITAQLGPCIRPPHYEVDFAAEIVRQLRAAGVNQVWDCEENTAADLQRYYSYRMEKGQTGRMLALLMVEH